MGGVRSAWAGPILLLAVVALLAGQGSAIFEDEAGVHDWLLQNIGQVVTADLTDDALLVASPQVIARVDPLTSDLIWRQLLPFAYPVVSLHRFGDVAVALHGPSAVVAASAWAVADGALLWEAAHVSHCSASAVALAADDSDGADILLLCSGTLSVVDLRSGRVLSPPSEGRTVVAVDGRRLLAEEGGRLLALEGTRAVEVGPSRPLLAASSAVALVALSDSTLTIVTDATGVEAASFTGIDEYLPSHAAAAVELSVTGASDRLLIAVRFPCSTTLLLWSSSEGLERVREVSHECGSRGVHSLTREGEEIFGCVTSSDESVTMELWGAEREAKSVLEIQSLPKNSGRAVEFYGMEGERILVVHEDFTLSFLDLTESEGILLWKREESLSTIQSAIVVDALEAPHSSFLRATVTEGNLLELFTTRVSGQLEYLSHILSFQGESHTNSERESERERASESVKESESLNEGERESEPLPPRSERLSSAAERKILVVTTALGSVFGLSTDGEHAVLWKAFFPHQSVREILETREALREEQSLCSLLLKDLTTGKFAVVTLSPISGAVLQRTELEIADVTVFALLPFHCPDRSRILLIANDRRQAEIYPDTVATRATVALQESEVFLYRVLEKAARGFALQEDLEGEAAFSLLPLWTIPFPRGEIAVAESRVREEVTFSPIRILPNGEAVPKYVNSNVVAVATLAVEETVIDGQSQQSEEYLTLYLIDAVSGRLLYHAVLEDAAEPVSLVTSENWVAVSFWNRKAYGHHLAVVDLYEEDLPWEQGARSSFEHVPLQAFDQVYEFPRGIAALGVTQTQRGITNRLLLVGTSADQLVAVDKRMVDPRRPIAGTPEALEGEGLSPHVPGPLPLNQRSFLSHNHQVQAVRQIRAFPSVLESTSYVVAWGLDVFFAPVFPSEKFDVLQSSFNHFALVTTVAVLLFLTVGSTVMRNRQRLEAKWA